MIAPCQFLSFREAGLWMQVPGLVGAPFTFKHSSETSLRLHLLLIINLIHIHR